MHIVVCLQPVHHRISARAGLDPGDVAALEGALTLREQYDATVTLVTLGPAEAVTVLKTGLSYGADRAVLLCDDAFAGSDALATGYVLAAAIRRLGASAPVALVLCGQRTREVSVTGPAIAHHLGWAHLTRARGIEAIRPEGTFIAERQLEHGREHLRLPLPVVVMMTATTQPLRYAGLPGVMRALRAVPEVWTAEELALEPARLGPAAAVMRTRLHAAPSPRTTGERLTINEDGLDVALERALAVISGQETPQRAVSENILVSEQG